MDNITEKVFKNIVLKAFEEDNAEHIRRRLENAEAMVEVDIKGRMEYGNEGIEKGEGKTLLF